MEEIKGTITPEQTIDGALETLHTIDGRMDIAGINRGGNVDDVQINGTSIVVDKVANIPHASADVYGVTTVSGEKVDSIENRVDVLEKMSKGILYDFVTQTVEGNQSIPKGSHLADVQKLEGKSIVWNQLFDKSGYNDSLTINGVTFTNNNDGSFTVNGTATADAKFYSGSRVGSQINGHKYLLHGCPFGGSESTYKLRTYGAGADFHDFGVGSITTSTTTSAYKPFQIEIYAGTTVNNLVFKPQLFDLTQMFGAGNEPALEECKALFTGDYYPYNVGELQSVENSKITVRGKNFINVPNIELYKSGYVYNGNVDITKGSYAVSWVGGNSSLSFAFTNKDGVDFINKGVTRNTSITLTEDAKKMRVYSSVAGTYENFQIELGSTATPYSPYHEPTEIPLAFVGKSAGTVRDELDLMNKQYIQRVGSVDLGSFDWIRQYVSESVGYAFQSSPFTTEFKAGSTNYLTNNYVCNGGTRNSLTADRTMAAWNAVTTLYFGIRDDSYSDATAFKNAMQGVMLYYELTEPIITDVSTVIDSFEVEGNGSIEFDSSIPVKNTIEYLRYLNEV